MTRTLVQKLKFIAATLSVVALGTTSYHAYAADCETYPVSPTGTVLVAKPTITWRLVPALGTKIAKVSVTVDNKPVTSQYNDSTQSVTYSFTAPLNPGIYAVDCTVTFDDDTDIDKSWTFTVAKNALQALPKPTPEQLAAAERVNAYRHALNLPPLDLNPALCAAAAAHSTYLKDNSTQGHDELESNADFVGQGPADRVAAFGYSASSYEDLCYGTKDIANIVQQLFDAPYHRTPFLQPGTTDVGMAVAGSKATIEFGVSSDSGTTCFPAENTPINTLTWMDRETPNPLRLWGGPSLVGYPITFCYFSGDSEAITVPEASLTVNGHDVPIYLNTPANDNHLTNSAILIPKFALLPNKTYTVWVKAATASGKDITRTWKFSTLGNREASNHVTD